MTDALDATKLAELEELLAKATPGRMEIYKRSEAVEIRVETGVKVRQFFDVPIKPSLMVGDDGKVYAHLLYDAYRQFPDAEWHAAQEALAEALAALRNAAPALIAAARERDYIAKIEGEEYMRAVRTNLEVKRGLAARGESDAGR